MENTSDTIYFNFSYFALKLLGKGLYSNHWTAISELVANGLDAQATSVKIYINMKNKENSVIEIFDNGYGMDYYSLAEKYVLIGKDKRSDNEIGEHIKNQLMGRKGIGKLAALYLSNKYFLISKTVNSNESAWCLNAADVKDSDIPMLERCELDSIEIEAQEEWNKFKTGTMIKLTNVNLTNFGIKTLDALKAKLADFYLLEELKGRIEVSILEHDYDKIRFEAIEKSIAFKNMCAIYDNSEMKIYKKLANGVRITSKIKEIGDKLREVEILPAKSFQFFGSRRFSKGDGSLTEKEIPYKLTGWIGIHTSIKKEDAIINDPDYLRNKVYRPNQLRLYVRKKLAVENFLEYVKNTQAFSNYIEGEISFDILDCNELDDIATSNRQGFIEDDERVQLLIELLKPIINNLIRIRIKLGNQVTEEEEFYRKKAEAKAEEQRIKKEKAEAKAKKAEAEKREEEKKRKKAEEEKNEAEKKFKEAEKQAEDLDFDLKSEKKRNLFLMDSLDDNKIDFVEKLHMLKINIYTMNNTIKNQVKKFKKGSLKESDIWNGFKTMSYLIARMKALLEYSALAKFDIANEAMYGDLFEFIKEYCEEILNKNEEIILHIKILGNSVYDTNFVPQDISIILDNVVSNSVKHKASNLFVNMDLIENEAIIDFTDDGKGLDKQIVDKKELFEFGKSYTKTGTGVGLYHIKNIVEQNLKGKVEIMDCVNGFRLQVRL